ncbi:hypothetical protein AWH04_28350 [Rhodococcus erythropolis]|nr:hypothetical protein AWH04_28350 [Rhodococcus erythropolis]
MVADLQPDRAAFAGATLLGGEFAAPIRTPPGRPATWLDGDRVTAAWAQVRVHLVSINISSPEKMIGLVT